jgi:hypothetical protein
MSAGPINGVRELLDRYSAGERNFAYAELSRSHLFGVHLGEANFFRADLSLAELRAADLRGANLRGVNLRGANLAGANLTRVDLTGAILREADLSGARLSNANLSQVDFRGADLSAAALHCTDLHEADLSGANLTDAEVSGSILDDTIFRQAVLTNADFTDADLSNTALLDVSLGALCRVPTTHSGPSHVDVQSVVRSVGEAGLKNFLRKIGMPGVFVEYMFDCARSLQPDQVFSLLQSTFISYGGPDERFARKLNDALEREGVTTFFFKDDAPPGEKLHRVMRKGVNEHDRVILICSENSLERPGVLNELEETLARESRDGGNTYLIPVRLDDYVINDWKPSNADLARAVRDRVISDFRNNEDPETFRAELAKLIGVLKNKPVNPIVHT